MGTKMADFIWSRPDLLNRKSGRLLWSAVAELGRIKDLLNEIVLTY